LLLDEPTNGVDPVSRREFWKLLYDLNSQGSTILVSSSYMDEAERANRYALIHHGKMISVGEPHEARKTFTLNVYEVDCESPRRAKEAIGSHSEFLAVNIFGNSVHILTQPEVGIEHVRDIVEATGLKREDVTKIVPTFEDIYIGLSTTST
jgi:ABC-2 type transport system ATP-binding protein